jgi:hypothetical protein
MRRRSSRWRRTSPPGGHDLARGGQRGSGARIVCRPRPAPLMEPDIYYPQKGSCLGGAEGVHKVSQPFHAPALGL